MFFIVIGVILLILAAILGCALGAGTDQAKGIGLVPGFAVAGVVWFLLMLVVSIPFSIHSVSNGHVGLIKTGGKITGQTGSGWVITAPWQTVEKATVQTQAECPDGSTPENNACKSSFAAFSSETIDVTISAIINYNVDPGNIQRLYTDVGANYAAKIVLPKATQYLKEETVKYTAIEIAPHREDIRKAVTSKLASDLAAKSITIEDFIVINVDFPNPEVKKAIDQKVINSQQAEAAQAGVATSEATAKQSVAKANGDASVSRAAAQARADNSLTEAKAQAEANRLLNESLTPNLLTLESIKKLNPSIQAIVIPSGGANGGVNFLDLSNILKSPVAAK